MLTMRFFLAGIMQGSHVGAVLHDQDYRARIKRLLVEHVPGADVYDPLADHATSLEYDDDRAREVFWHHNRLCRKVDVVLAFLPAASIGTAIEMFEAYEHDRIVVAISPMVHNWAIKFLSHLLYTDMEQFEQAVRSGDFARRLDELRRDPGRAANQSSYPGRQPVSVESSMRFEVLRLVETLEHQENPPLRGSKD